MDGARFDSLVKGLGRARSRRGVLGAAAAAAIAAVGIGDRSDAAPGNGNSRCKDRGRPCSHDTNCCFGICCNKTCCDEGQVCNGAFCVPVPTPTPTPTPEPPVCTVDCGAQGECATGCVCAQSVTGTAYCVTLGAANCVAACTSDADCSSGFCATSTCCGATPSCVLASSICAT